MRSKSCLTSHVCVRALPTASTVLSFARLHCQGIGRRLNLCRWPSAWCVPLPSAEEPPTTVTPWWALLPVSLCAIAARADCTAVLLVLAGGSCVRSSRTGSLRAQTKHACMHRGMLEHPAHAPAAVSLHCQPATAACAHGLAGLALAASGVPMALQLADCGGEVSYSLVTHAQSSLSSDEFCVASAGLHWLQRPLVLCNLNHPALEEVPRSWHFAVLPTLAGIAPKKN
jgi:hypothetical protein